MQTLKLIGLLKKFIFVFTIFFACGQFVEICTAPAKKGKKSKKRPKKKGKKKAKKGKAKKGKGSPGKISAAAAPAAAAPTPIIIVPTPKISAPMPAVKPVPQVVATVATTPVEPTRLTTKTSAEMEAEKKAAEAETLKKAQEETAEKQKIEKTKKTEEFRKAEAARVEAEALKKRQEETERQRAAETEQLQKEEALKRAAEARRTEEAKAKAEAQKTTPPTITPKATFEKTKIAEIPISERSPTETVIEKPATPVEKIKEKHMTAPKKPSDIVVEAAKKLGNQELEREISIRVDSLKKILNGFKQDFNLNFDLLSIDLLFSDLQEFLKKYGDNEKTKAIISNCFNFISNKYDILVNDTIEKINKKFSINMTEKNIVDFTKQLFQQINPYLTLKLLNQWSAEIERQFSDKQKNIAKEFAPIALRMAIANQTINNLFIDLSTIDGLKSYSKFVTEQTGNWGNLSNSISNPESILGIGPLPEEIVKTYKDDFILYYLSTNISEAWDAINKEAKQKGNPEPPVYTFINNLALIYKTTAKICFEVVANVRKKRLEEISDFLHKLLDINKNNDTQIIFDRFGTLFLSSDTFKIAKSRLKKEDLFEKTKTLVYNKISPEAKNNFLDKFNLKELLIDSFVDNFLQIASVMHNKISRFYMPDIFETEFIYITAKNMKLKITEDSDKQFINQEIEFNLFYDFGADTKIKEKTKGIVILPPVRLITKVELAKAIVASYNPQV